MRLKLLYLERKKRFKGRAWRFVKLGKLYAPDAYEKFAERRSEFYSVDRVVALSRKGYRETQNFLRPYDQGRRIRPPFRRKFPLKRIFFIRRRRKKIRRSRGKVMKQFPAALKVLKSSYRAEVKKVVKNYPPKEFPQHLLKSWKDKRAVFRLPNFKKSFLSRRTSVAISPQQYNRIDGRWRNNRSARFSYNNKRPNLPWRNPAGQSRKHQTNPRSLGGKFKGYWRRCKERRLLRLFPNYYKHKYRRLSKFNRNKRFLKSKRRWHKCKRPYWRRRSYWRIIQQKRLLQNIFYKRNTDTARWPNILRKKKTSWLTYYKRNSFKYHYKNKILFRYYWRSRYFIWSRNSLRNTILSLRRKRQKILYFLRKFELSLDRYLIWWGIIPFIARDIKYSRMLIQNGFILVNFFPVCNIRYSVKKGDCIMCVLHTIRKTRWRWLVPEAFFASNRITVRKVLFLRGYRLGYRRPRIMVRRRRRLYFSNVLLLWLWTKRGWNNSFPPHLLRASNAFERSYFYHIWVNLNAVSWFNLLFSSSSTHFESNCYLINHISRLKQF